MSQQPYIDWVEDGQASGELAAIYARAKRGFAGFLPPAVKIFSVRPEVAAAMEQLRSVLLGDASSLGARRADLIGGAISGLNHCEYCGTAHTSLLVKRGELAMTDAEQLYRDWRVLDLEAADRAMLEFAEKLTFSPSQVSAADIQALREAGFTEENVFDIVLLSAYRNFMNRVNDGFGVPSAELRQRFGDGMVQVEART